MSMWISQSHLFSFVRLFQKQIFCIKWQRFVVIGQMIFLSSNQQWHGCEMIWGNHTLALFFPHPPADFLGKSTGSLWYRIPTTDVPQLSSGITCTCIPNTHHNNTPQIHSTSQMITSGNLTSLITVTKFGLSKCQRIQILQLKKHNA